MPNNVKIKYRDHDVSYREDQNEWWCFELNFSAASLSALKLKIDGLERAARKTNKLPAFLIKDWNSQGAERVQITVVCDLPVTSHRYGRTTEESRECWVTSKKGRQKVYLKDLVPIEHEAQVKQWLRAQAEASAAQDKAEKLKDSLPRFDIDSVMLAVKEKEVATP